MTNAPYLLVIFLPGGAVQVDHYYCYHLSHLASNGFPVFAWNTRETPEKQWPGYINRPLEASLLIDTAESMTAPGGDLAGMIDTQHVGMEGHSFGGATALIVAGAPLNFGWCDAYAELARMSTEFSCRHYKLNLEAFTAMTEQQETWPVMSDARVSAVIAMAPNGQMWGADYESMAAVKIPALIMTGELDESLPPKYCAIPIYEHLGSPNKTFISLGGKGHLVFMGEFEDDRYLTNHFTTAFWLAELKGDSEAAKALLPENVNLSGVALQTTVEDY